MFKKIAAILLAALMCIMAVGCSGDDAPDGMHLVSLDGEPFKLYVPNSWSDNRVSGISGAYFSSADNIAVSARYFSADEDVTLVQYVDECISSYSKALELFDLEENQATVLSGVDARELVYDAKISGVKYTFRELIAKYLGDFVILTFRAPAEKYSDCTEQFDLIIDEFVLCEKAEPINDCVTDKKTPDGMKIASSDDIEYRLYVPTSWVCSSESGRSEAYVSESGRPNVTVTSYSPDGDISAEKYFKMCEEKYEDELSGYSFVSSEERTVAERNAISYTYSASYDGADITVMQTVLVYNGMVYSITYTALADSFESHMSDVNAILDAFIFR